MAQQQPYPPPPHQPVPPPRKHKKRGRFTCLQRLLIAGIAGGFLLLGLVAAGYTAYATGAIGQRELLALIGQGRGEVNLINLSDDRLDARLERYEEESGSYESYDSASAAPLEITGRALEQGQYILTLSTPGGVPVGGTCALTIQQGDVYQFVAVPAGIAVTKEGYTAQTADDMKLATSSLCQ